MAKTVKKARTASTKSKSKAYFDPILLIAVLCIALAGIAFVLYASAATVESVIH